jgi:hypothetical protein
MSCCNARSQSRKVPQFIAQNDRLDAIVSIGGGFFLFEFSFAPAKWIAISA